jgi:hypothetical protein
MIWVGLMGGAAYVNTYHLILEDKNISKDEKELAIGICK